MRTCVVLLLALMIPACALAEEAKAPTDVPRPAPRQYEESAPEQPAPAVSGRAPRYRNESRLAAQAARVAADNEQLQAMVPDCASDRAERLAIADAYRARRDKQIDADNWKNEHCKSVDNSKPVVRRMQDSSGRIYFQEGRDRAVDIACPKNDRTMPPEAKPGYEWPPLPTVSNQVIDRNSKCREVDEASGAKTSP